MSSPEDPMPYLDNEYRNKVGMISDAAALILDGHTHSSHEHNGRKIRVAQWDDGATNRTYELVAFADPLSADTNAPDQLELKEVNSFPNGETSVRKLFIRPSLGALSVQWLKMTTDQEAEHAERVMDALTTDQGLRILPPRKDGVNPEHEAELVLGIMERGLDILNAKEELAQQETLRAIWTRIDVAIPAKDVVEGRRETMRTFRHPLTKELVGKATRHDLRHPAYKKMDERVVATINTHSHYPDNEAEDTLNATYSLSQVDDEFAISRVIGERINPQTAIDIGLLKSQRESEELQGQLGLTSVSELEARNLENTLTSSYWTPAPWELDES